MTHIGLILDQNLQFFVIKKNNLTKTEKQKYSPNMTQIYCPKFSKYYVLLIKHYTCG